MNGAVCIAGPERAPFKEIISRYLKSVGDQRQVVQDAEARYFGGQLEERSLVPLGLARFGELGLEEWLRQPHKERSEEHTSELQSLMRISYAVFGLHKKKIK